MERWSIQVDKQDFRFSAAHFLIFPDGSAERLHGHNYRVAVEVEAGLDEHGLVIDFQRRYIDRKKPAGKVAGPRFRQVDCGIITPDEGCCRILRVAGMKF